MSPNYIEIKVHRSIIHLPKRSSDILGDSVCGQTAACCHISSRGKQFIAMPPSAPSIKMLDAPVLEAFKHDLDACPVLTLQALPTSNLQFAHLLTSYQRQT